MIVNVVCFVTNDHIHGLAKADCTVAVPVDPWCTGGHCGHARTRVWSSGAARVGLEAVGVAASSTTKVCQYFSIFCQKSMKSVESNDNQWKSIKILSFQRFSMTSHHRVVALAAFRGYVCGAWCPNACPQCCPMPQDPTRRPKARIRRPLSSWNR